MNKESRLSFRISENLNDEIEKMVIVKRDIRDRSDLGNQSINFYLKTLDNEKIEEELFLSAIIAIAEKAGKDDIKEVKKLKKQLKELNKLTSNPLEEPSKIKF